MLFNSFEFLIFFPIVVGLYFAVRPAQRWMLLLGASYVFYAAWEPAYLLLIIGSTLVDYWAGLQMGAQETRAGRRPYLIVSLMSNLGILLTFKYFNFFSESLQAVSQVFAPSLDLPMLDVLLPVGISFYTFQTLAYSIDVYRGQADVERHLGLFALYVSFFPQLVAGPIERSQRLLPQFRETCDFDYARVTNGLKLMAWGLFKKVVIADRIGVYVDAVYNQPEAYAGLPVIIATYFFAFQIYCDFSGYSDMAIGAAQVMGINLMENFRRPYFAKSIAEFWRRWHISLSTWFRDYLYIPLGGNRVTRVRWLVNLIIVFLVSGLWHGAAWTFVIWGGLHGLYLVAGILTAPYRERLWGWLSSLSAHPAVSRAGFRLPVATDTVRRWVAVGTTFHLVLLAWVFFRANSMADAFTLLSRMVPFGAQGPLVVGLEAVDFAVSLTAIGVLLVVHLVERRQDMRMFLSRQPVLVRWPVYVTMVASIVLFGWFERTAFIYFQF